MYLSVSDEINSIYKSGKNCYKHAFLEECKYKIKEKKTKILIVDDVEISDDDDCNEKDFEESSE